MRCHQITVEAITRTAAENGCGEKPVYASIPGVFRASADHCMVGQEPDTRRCEGDGTEPSMHRFSARALSACGDHRQGRMLAISKRRYADDARKLAAINAEAYVIPEPGAALEYRHAEAFVGEADRRRQAHQGAADDDRSIGRVCKLGHGTLHFQ